MQSIQTPERVFGEGHFVNMFFRELQGKHISSGWLWLRKKKKNVREEQKKKEDICVSFWSVSVKL